jgi:hypothetical protein
MRAWRSDTIWDRRAPARHATLPLAGIYESVAVRQHLGSPGAGPAWDATLSQPSAEGESVAILLG